MRIVLLHSYYSSRHPSGENSVVDDQANALRDAGHDVDIVFRHTDDEERRPAFGISSAFRVATGLTNSPEAVLKKLRPDIIHIHNLFPNIGTRWIRSWQGPIVQSLHNYRFACSNGLMYRQESVCMDCTVSGSITAIRHACYRSSRIATTPLAVSRPATARSLRRDVDAVVTTSPSSDMIVRRIMPDLKTTLIPNFVHAPGKPRSSQMLPNHWVALGRMTPEKGLRELVEMWPAGFRLDVIGDGPEERRIRASANPDWVSVQASMPREEMRARLADYEGLVFPSRWLEVAPQVVVEAMRLGLPVVALEANGISDFVEATHTGMAYANDDSLKAALLTVQANRSLLSSNATRFYEENWTREVWLRDIECLYASLAK